MVSLHELAIETIRHLDLKPHSTERAAHKLNMIRIAERCHFNLRVDHDDARQQIIAAAEWCESAQPAV